MKKVTDGQKVIIYDRFRFAIPIFGIAIGRSSTNDGVQVQLTTTNNPAYPIGCDIWVSRRQLRIAKGG